MYAWLHDDGLEDTHQLCVELGQPWLAIIVEDKHCVNHD